MSTTKRFSPSWDPETTVVIKVAPKPTPEARTETLIKKGGYVYPAPTTFHKQVLSTLETQQKYSFFGEHGAIMGERAAKRWRVASGRGPQERFGCVPWDLALTAVCCSDVLGCPRWAALV